MVDREQVHEERRGGYQHLHLHRLGRGGYQQLHLHRLDLKQYILQLQQHSTIVLQIFWRQRVMKEDGSHPLFTPWLLNPCTAGLDVNNVGFFNHLTRRILNIIEV